jgi:DNA mismatch repair protein MutH
MEAAFLRHAARANMQDNRNWGRLISLDATIGFMAKFRPIRANAKKTTRPQGAAGCVILILLIMVGVMVFLYLVMKSNANG